MIKTPFAILMMLSSVSAFAEESAAQKLLDAVAVCPKVSNPMMVLKSMGGNAFVGAEFDGGNDTVIADIVYDPRRMNPLLTGPIRMLGKIRVSMEYPAPGYGLLCKVSRE